MDEKPNTPSADHAAMADYWSMVDAIMGGAKTMRAAGETFLPKFEVESDQEYRLRSRHARFTNVYRDIVENLAQRPFGKEVHLGEGVATDIEQFATDVDGRGNNLHVFAGETFFAGINKAVDWILVDYTKGVPEGATRAEEARIGARPFWCRYPAESVIAAYSDIIGGREEFVHVRLKEAAKIREGFKETTKERVRVLNRELLDDGTYGPPTYEVWQKVEGTKDGEEWVVIEGPAPISIGVIPLAPVVMGRRKGSTWQFHPPMRDAAELQIDLYQQENALKNAKTYTAFPMLAGNGVDPVVGDDGVPKPLAIGPKTVLYGGSSDGAGRGGTWEFIEPDASSLQFLASDIKETVNQLRELGRQPLTAQSGNLTVVTTAFAAQKGNAAIQAWAINLKDALERAFEFTAMWLGTDGDVEVMIDTDFDLGFGDDASFEHVLKMADGEAPLISREAAIHEAKRRGILDPSYDGDEDLDEILRQIEDDDGDEDDPPARVAAE